MTTHTTTPTDDGRIARTNLYGPHLDIQVFETESGDYEAIEEMGASARSGNEIIAAVNLLDQLAGDEMDVDVTIRGGGD